MGYVSINIITQSFNPLRAALALKIIIFYLHISGNYDFRNHCLIVVVLIIISCVGLQNQLIASS